MVINFFNEILNFSNRDHNPPFVFNLAFKYSEDRGVTWLPKNKPVRAQTLATLAQFRAFGTILPSGYPFHSPNSGRLADILGVMMEW